MFDIINKPLGYVLKFFADILGGNFAAAVFLFTLLINIVMIPLSIKSQKSSVQQARIKPKLDELKKRYGDDKQKYNMEMQKLYQEENVSMAGGCLPMILRLVIMMSIYSLIYSPLTYMSGIDTKSITNINDTINTTITDVNKISEETAKTYTSELDWQSSRSELSIVAIVNDQGKRDTLKELFGEKKFNTIKKAFAGNKDVDKQVEAVNKTLETLKKNDPEAYNTYMEKLGWTEKSKTKDMVNTIINNEEKTVIFKSLLGEEGYEKIEGDLEKVKNEDKINYTFFTKKINLTDSPKFSINIGKAFKPIWFMPIIAFLAQILSSLLSMQVQKKTNPEAPKMSGMLLTMPIISLVIGFSLPGGVTFYWACSSLVGGLIQVGLQVFYGPQKMLAKERVKELNKQCAFEEGQLKKITAEDAE